MLWNHLGKLFLEKWPEQISQIGPQLPERLLLEEKKTSGNLPPDQQSPLNECRRILVTEVLPVIINSPNLTNLGAKVYYKWFQKVSRSGIHGPSAED